MLLNIFSFTLTLLILIPISILGINGIFLALPLLMLWSVLYFARKSSLKFNTKKINISISFILVLLFVAMVPVIKQQNSFELLKMTAFGLIIYLTCILYVFCINEAFKENAVKSIFENIYYVGVLNSFVAIIVLVSPSLRGLIYSVIDTSPLNEIHLSIGMRSSGLFYFGGSIMSVFHCVVFYMALIYIANLKRKVSWYDYVFLLMNIAGIFVSGRFGFVLLILLVISLVTLPAKITAINKKVLLNLIAGAAFCMVIIVLNYYNQFKRLLDWGLEVFLNYFRDGQLRSHSTDVLETMYKFPHDLISGEGIFSQINVASDSGYILLIWYFGITAILFYFFLFLYHYLLARSSTSQALKNSLIFILFVIFIGNFKDIYLFASNGITQIYCIILLLCLTSRRVTENASVIESNC